jgi:hypothetical protein
MRRSAVPGQHIEILLADVDRVLEIDLVDDDPAVAGIILDAIEQDDADEAESRLRMAAAGNVHRRP